MESGSVRNRWNMICIVAAVFFVVAVQLAHAVSCPQPSNLEALKIGHDSITFGWDATQYISNVRHTTCVSRSDREESGTSDDSSTGCVAGVTGRTKTQPHLRADTAYTTCVRTECSDSNFSVPICKTFKTSPTASSQPRRNIAADRDSSSLGVKWRVPSGLKGRLDGYRTRWCQSFKCVTREQTGKDPLALSVKLSQLDPYRQYTVYMRAFAVDPSNGQKRYGTESSLVVYNMETYGPSEPIQLLIKATNSSTLLVTWPKQDAYAAQFDSYSVDWSKAEPSGTNGSPLHSQTLPANSTSFFLYDLEPDASYRVWLSRVNRSNGAHAGPHTRHGADGALPEPCGKPEALRAEVRPWSNSHRVWVTWDASRTCQGSPVKRYTVKLCPVHDQKIKGDLTRCSKHMVTITDNAGVVVLEGLKNVSHYRLELRELVSREDGGSDEGQPAIVFSTTSGSGQPTRYDREVTHQNPRGIRVEVKRYLNSSVASVTWNVSKDTEQEQSVSRYALKLCPICDDELKANITECHSRAVSASAGKAIFPALKELCEYTLEARALVEREGDEKDEERKSAIVTFVTPGPALPSLADSLRAELNGNSVKLYWRKPAILRGYGVVYDVRLFRPESNSVFVEAVVEDTEKTLLGLQPRTTYSVDVAVCVARARRLHCGGNATLHFQTRPNGKCFLLSRSQLFNEKNIRTSIFKPEAQIRAGSDVLCSSACSFRAFRDAEAILPDEVVQLFHIVSVHEASYGFD
ncbi:collagen alpha-1(XII) chain-like [Dermacentor andersoni]|uniref:collagen alpha-1(XII) chain-like n=1 Tax=Dermacentor andersoni TaxID=34620 RepID=UPI002415BE90|nr:receptor-type tyrosine-protein phosphatase F-like [Dermacentor andersoni]